jgi:hypothetical protein
MNLYMIYTQVNKHGRASATANVLHRAEHCFFCDMEVLQKRDSHVIFLLRRAPETTTARWARPSLSARRAAGSSPRRTPRRGSRWQFSTILHFDQKVFGPIFVVEFLQSFRTYLCRRIFEKFSDISLSLNFCKVFVPIFIIVILKRFQHKKKKCNLLS